MPEPLFASCAPTRGGAHQDFVLDDFGLRRAAIWRTTDLSITRFCSMSTKAGQVNQLSAPYPRLSREDWMVSRKNLTKVLLKVILTIIKQGILMRSKDHAPDTWGLSETVDNAIWPSQTHDELSGDELYGVFDHAASVRATQTKSAEEELTQPAELAKQLPYCEEQLPETD